MQQKMILQSVRTVQTEEAPSEENVEQALCRGLLIAFADAGLLPEGQVRAALTRLETP